MKFEQPQIIGNAIRWPEGKGPQPGDEMSPGSGGPTATERAALNAAEARKSASTFSTLDDYLAPAAVEARAKKLQEKARADREREELERKERWGI